ncbi:MAG: hypothetical protein ACYDAJ_07225 [Nitrosotalea sp.]
MIVQNTNDSIEKIIPLVEQIPTNTKIIVEKRVRGQRGPDKMPRKVSLNSINNLKQYRKNAELDHSIMDNGNGFNNSRFFTVILIISLMVIIGIIIWKLYRSYLNTI